MTSLNQQNQENFTFTCKGFDLIIVLGTLLSREDEALFEEVKSAVDNGAKLVYLFTMEDKELLNQMTFFSRYEVGSEEGVLALLAKELLRDETLPEELEDYFNALDEGYLSAESNFGEEEIEEINALYQNSHKPLLVLGENLFTHPRASNIALLAGLIAHFGKAKIWMPEPNEVVAQKENFVIPEAIATLKSFDGVVVYKCPSKSKNEEEWLIGSAQFQMAAKVQDGEKIRIAINQEVYSRTFVLDHSLKGTIALMPRSCENDTSYCYGVAKIVK